MATETHISEDELRLFDLGTWVYPQPVAISCGRIVRSRSPESLVDAILKSARFLPGILPQLGLLLSHHERMSTGRCQSPPNSAVLWRLARF